MIGCGARVARGLRQAQPERTLIVFACLVGSVPKGPLSLSLSKHVLSFAEGAARQQRPQALATLRLGEAQLDQAPPPRVGFDKLSLSGVGEGVECGIWTLGTQPWMRMSEGKSQQQARRPSAGWDLSPDCRTIVNCRPAA